MECWIFWRKSRWWIMGACPMFSRWSPSYRRALGKFNLKCFFYISLQLGAFWFSRKERGGKMSTWEPNWVVICVCILDWQVAILTLSLFLMWWFFLGTFFLLFIFNLILCLVAEKVGKKIKEWKTIGLNPWFRSSNSVTVPYILIPVAWKSYIFLFFRKKNRDILLLNTLHVILGYTLK